VKDEVWAVVVETMRQYKGVEPTQEHRAAVESRCRLVEFDGGAFVIHGNEIDLFVVSDRRRRWATRGLLDRVVGGVIREHGKAVCRIHEDNAVSLRFARRLGFTEAARDGKWIQLESKKWAES
jgi:GNAT superfamily N-acetyltransferase